MDDDTTGPPDGSETAPSRDELLAMMQGDYLGHLLDDLEAATEELKVLTAMQKRMREVRKGIIRALWESNGLTLREASIVFRVPKSTLHDWAQKGEWRQ